jgi:hypothetical protein
MKIAVAQHTSTKCTSRFTDEAPCHQVLKYYSTIPMGYKSKDLPLISSLGLGGSLALPHVPQVSLLPPLELVYLLKPRKRCNPK